MNSLNSLLLEGNLTRDPVLYQTPKGTSVCTFSIGTNRFYKQNEETQKEVSFFDIETWAGLAERCGEWLSKGRGVRVVGRLKQDRWTDKDGKMRTRIKVVAEHVEFRPDFRKNEEQEEEQLEESGAEAASAEEVAVAEKEPAARKGKKEKSAEEVPF
jgi:single-strand DNA-binding protein